MSAPGANTFDYSQLGAELIRALRGKRSQTVLSRRLGYKTNVVYIWEAQKGAPTGAGFLRLAQRVGVDVRRALEQFYRKPPPWLAEQDPTSVEGVAALLDDLRGASTLVETAAKLRVSRFALARWLRGEAEPRLPDFLELIEASSLRVLDFVAALVDPLEVPSLAQLWQELQASRRAAYQRPWSHAVLRALELRQYRELPAHKPGWIGGMLGIDQAEEEACLELLADTGQIERRQKKWHVKQVLTVDTRKDPEAARHLKAWWARVGSERFLAQAEGVFSYNLFAVSNADLERIEALQRAYFRELRSIVAQSAPVENVAVVNLQLFSLLVRH
ncbi:MAG: Family ership [Pseudomonadota bacterium]|jgi:transcriptional regulator with XRE-family HTH domain